LGEFAVDAESAPARILTAELAMVVAGIRAFLQVTHGRLVFLGAVSRRRDERDRDAVHAGVSTAVGTTLLVGITVCVAAAFLGADSDCVVLQDGAGEEEGSRTTSNFSTSE
jgi:hypothetical protein